MGPGRDRPDPPGAPCLYQGRISDKQRHVRQQEEKGRGHLHGPSHKFLLRSVQQNGNGKSQTAQQNPYDISVQKQKEPPGQGHTQAEQALHGFQKGLSWALAGTGLILFLLLIMGERLEGMGEGTGINLLKPALKHRPIPGLAPGNRAPWQRQPRTKALPPPAG